MADYVDRQVPRRARPELRHRSTPPTSTSPAAASTWSSPTPSVMEEFLATPRRRRLRGGRRAGLRRRDPRHRRRHRPAQGRHRAQGEVQRGAGGDHRVRRVQDDQRQVHRRQHPAASSRGAAAADGGPGRLPPLLLRACASRCRSRSARWWSGSCSGCCWRWPSSPTTPGCRGRPMRLPTSCAASPSSSSCW